MRSATRFCAFNAVLWALLAREGLFGTAGLNRWFGLPQDGQTVSMVHAVRELNATDIRPDAALEQRTNATACSRLTDTSRDWSAPFVVRGFRAGSAEPTADGAAEAWSPEWFKEHLGQQLIATRSHAHLAKPNHLAGETLSRRRLGEAIDDMQRLQADDGEARLYVNFNEELFGGDLLDALQLDERLQAVHRCGPYAADFDYQELFLGRGEERNTTGSALHAWGVYNFFVQVRGAKKWTFVAPEHLRYLSSIDGLTYFRSHEGTTLESAHVPELKALPRHEVLVQPGDLLFVPPWWAHEIKNEPGWNVAFATKNFAHRENLRVQPARSLMMYSFLAFTHGPSWLLGAKLSGGSEAVNHGETAAVLRRLLLVLVCVAVVVNAAMLRRRTRRHTAAKSN